MPMQTRSFTRLTNGFSKKRTNLVAAVGLRFAHYSLFRIHKTLTMTPEHWLSTDGRLLWPLPD